MLTNRWIWITSLQVIVFALVMLLVANARPAIIVPKVVIYQNPVLADIIVLEHEI
jgi:hypothetical protein